MNSPGKRPALALALFGVALLAVGCAGDNIFPSGVGSAGGGAPTVEITTPQEGFTTSLGTQLRIVADVNAPEGLVSAVYSGVYVGTSASAYEAETETFGQSSFATLDNVLSPAAGQVTGDVYVIVRVTDAMGEAKADTVQITID